MSQLCPKNGTPYKSVFSFLKDYTICHPNVYIAKFTEITTSVDVIVKYGDIIAKVDDK